jgi:hypothetical protein
VPGQNLIENFCEETESENHPKDAQGMNIKSADLGRVAVM